MTDREFVFVDRDGMAFEQGFRSEVMPLNGMFWNGGGWNPDWTAPFHLIPEGPVLIEMEVNGDNGEPVLVMLVEDPDIETLTNFMFRRTYGGPGRPPLLYREFNINEGQKLRQVVNPTHPFIGLATRLNTGESAGLTLRLTALGIPERPPSSIVRGEVFEQLGAQ